MGAVKECHSGVEIKGTGAGNKTNVGGGADERPQLREEVKASLSSDNSKGVEVHLGLRGVASGSCRPDSPSV